MPLEVNIHSSEEEDSIRIQIDIPKQVYDAVKGIAASVDAGKTLIQEIQQLWKGKDNV